MPDHAQLFVPEDSTPAGFRYTPGLVTQGEEQALADAIARLAFAHVRMRGVVAKRRTVHYGWDYAYETRRTQPGEPIPPFLWAVRAKAAAWADVGEEDFAEALVTEYSEGAGIGWHRDAPMFGDVIAGVSLLSECRMKFRPYVSPAASGGNLSPRRTTHEVLLERRSGYLITGRARREFEHSIPRADGLRYSVTFRTLKHKA